MSLIEFEVSHCDDSLMSVVSSDGTLRVIQIGLLREESDRKHKGKKSEKSKKSKRKGGTSEEESDEDTRGYSVVLAQRSFFGAFLCVKWSPDDRFVVVSGKHVLCEMINPRPNILISFLIYILYDVWLCTIRLEEKMIWCHCGPLSTSAFWLVLRVISRMFQGPFVCCTVYVNGTDM